MWIFGRITPGTSIKLNYVAKKGDSRARVWQTVRPSDHEGSEAVDRKDVIGRTCSWQMRIATLTMFMITTFFGFLKNVVQYKYRARPIFFSFSYEDLGVGVKSLSPKYRKGG